MMQEMPPSLQHLVLAVLAVLAALASAPPAHAQMNDWERAEDTSEERDGEAAQPAELVAPPREEEAAPDGEGAAEGDAGGTEEGGGEREGEGAEDDPFGSLERGGAFHVYGDVGTFFGPADVMGLGTTGTVGRTDAFSVTPWLGARYEITDRVSLGVEWGFALLVHGDIAGPGIMEGGSAVFGPGNPLVYGRWLPTASEGDVVWGVDVGIAFPIASYGSLTAASAGAQILNYRLAVAERGGWDLHLFTESMPVTGGLFLEVRPLEGLLLRAEADVAILFDVADRLDGTKLVLQVGGDASYRLVPTFGLGARVAAIFAGENVLPNREGFQLSAAPYAKLFVDPAFVAAEFVFNLTEPYGVSFREGKYWGIRLLAGVTF
jgi:hypothetical protein